MTCLSVNEVGFNFISIEDRQNHRQIKLIGFTGDFLPVAFPRLIPSILLSLSWYLSTFDVGTLLVLPLFLKFFLYVFSLFSLFSCVNLDCICKYHNECFCRPNQCEIYNTLRRSDLECCSRNRPFRIRNRGSWSQLPSNSYRKSEEKSLFLPGFSRQH